MAELKQLRALQAVGEFGSFSGAADALNYTQPAISKTIAGLERELGAVLVERQARPVRLTDAGEALVRHADEMFARLSSARSEIEAIANVDAGSVSVATVASAGTSFVISALCEFRKRHPGVRVSIAEGGLPSALVRQLRAGDFDLAVVFDYPDAGEDIGVGLEFHHLHDAPFDVVLPPGHSLAEKTTIRPEELAEEDWLLPNFAVESPFLKLVARMCAAAGFEPRVATKINNCELTLAMVAAGEGVTVLPRVMLEPRHADVAVRPLADAPAQRIGAVRLPGRYLTPATAEFLALLRGAAARCAAAQPREPLVATATL